MFQFFSKPEVKGIFVGGVGALLLQGIAITAILNAPYIALVTKWGRYAVAIALVALFCIFYKTMSQVQAMIASLIAGSIIPSLLSKFVFGTGATWPMLIGFNLLFTVLALIIFRAVSKR